MYECEKKRKCDGRSNIGHGGEWTIVSLQPDICQLSRGRNSQGTVFQLEIMEPRALLGVVISVSLSGRVRARNGPRADSVLDASSSGPGRVRMVGELRDQRGEILLVREIGEKYTDEGADYDVLPVVCKEEEWMR